MAKTTIIEKTSGVINIAEKVDTELIEQMEGIIKQCALANAFGGASTTLTETMRLAVGVNAMRAVLTEEKMKPFMELQNTRLGFLTDRDPAKAKEGQRVTPYGLDTVRDCFIESMFRGLFPVGNQWNIIGGNCYVTRQGMEHLVKKYPNVSDVKATLSMPLYVEGKGGRPSTAWMQWRATWQQDGKEVVISSVQSGDEGNTSGIDTRISARQNRGQGDDAVLGKGYRKLYAKIYEHLTGVTPPDGDVNDIDAEAKIVSNAKEKASHTAPPKPMTAAATARR